jgi:hypothetical protein
VLDTDPELGTIELAFLAVEDFTTPFGTVLEGFLAAMLHDTVGPAVLATLAPDEFISTEHENLGTTTAVPVAKDASSTP